MTKWIATYYLEIIAKRKYKAYPCLIADTCWGRRPANSKRMSIYL